MAHATWLQKACIYPSLRETHGTVPCVNPLTLPLPTASALDTRDRPYILLAQVQSEFPAKIPDHKLSQQHNTAAPLRQDRLLPTSSLETSLGKLRTCYKETLYLAIGSS
jgi:hypothetical protein